MSDVVNDIINDVPNINTENELYTYVYNNIDDFIFVYNDMLNPNDNSITQFFLKEFPYKEAYAKSFCVTLILYFQLHKIFF